jgi:hypothetical protein
MKKSVALPPLNNDNSLKRFFWLAKMREILANIWFKRNREYVL